MGLTTIATHPKGFALMTKNLQLEITVNSTINGSQSTIDWGAKTTFTIGWGKPTSTIGWGARPVLMINWEAESMKSQTIGWKRWPILWSMMEISCAELLNVDTRYNWTMKGQAKHVRSQIRSGVQMA
jgi:hypothetical protein